MGAFAAGVFLAVMFALTASSMFPGEHRPTTLRGPLGGTLFWSMVVLVAGLAVHIAWFAAGELQWYLAVIVAGLIVLFAPGLHDLLRGSLREGVPGLVLGALLNIGLHGILWLTALP